MNWKKDRYWYHSQTFIFSFHSWNQQRKKSNSEDESYYC
jgi:hypothetical protein